MESSTLQVPDTKGHALPTRRVINPGTEMPVGGPVSSIEVQAGDVVIRNAGDDGDSDVQGGTGDTYRADGKAGLVLRGRPSARVSITYAYEAE